MNPALPPFHRQAVMSAEEVVDEAKARKAAADRLLVEIDELITPDSGAGARKEPR